jgi:hypothetical protein
VLTFQLMTANTWINAAENPDVPSPGDWSQLMN